MKLYEIHEAISELAPIDGVNSEGVIWFKDEATAAEKAAAQAKLDELLPLLED